MHRAVVGKWRIEVAGLASVRSNGLHADAEDIALVGEEFGACLREPRRMGAVVAHVEEFFAGRAGAPAGAQQHPSAGGNTSMRRLPGLDTLRREQEVLIGPHIR